MKKTEQERNPNTKTQSVKTSEQKNSEHRASEHAAPEKKSSESRSPQKKSPDHKSSEQKSWSEKSTYAKKQEVKKTLNSFVDRAKYYAKKVWEPLKPYLLDVCKNAKLSFVEASKGNEKFQIVVWYWGFISYLISFLILSVVASSGVWFISSAIALSVVAFYFWHIYAVWKCRPKELDPKKPTEPKKSAKHNEKNISTLTSIKRKLFLQEAWFRWNPVTIVIGIDLVFLLYFVGRI